jgi:hypothetical protein
MSATAGSKSEVRFTKIGAKLALQVDAPSREVTVVFEDDGETGYFYALAPGEQGMDLLDALHVYNNEGELSGADLKLDIVWSADSALAGLRINGTLWALFDFAAQSGWTRSEFPPPAGRWRMSEARPAWDEALVRRL